MDRREFMGHGIGALCLASSGLSSLQACVKHFNPPLQKKSLKWWMIKEDLSVLEKFRLIKELGFHGVELDSPDDIDIQEVIHAMQDTGLEVPGLVNSVHWKKPFSHPDPIMRKACAEAMKDAFVLCQKLGGDTVLLVPAVVNKEVSYDMAWERSTKEIKKLIPFAEQYDVRIAIENVWNNFLLSPLEAKRYIDQFESDRVGWYMDIGNVIRYGFPEQWIRILGSRILKIDIKDYSTKLANEEGVWKGFEAKLGEGSVDWTAVNQALVDIGYTGWGSAEVSGGDKVRLADISNRMDELYAA